MTQLKAFRCVQARESSCELGCIWGGKLRLEHLNGVSSTQLLESEGNGDTLWCTVLITERYPERDSSHFLFWCCTRPPHWIVTCLGNTVDTCSSPFGLRKKQNPRSYLSATTTCAVLPHIPPPSSWAFFSLAADKCALLISCPLGFANTNRVLPPAFVHQVFFHLL